jgi:hypothetical protein
MAIHIGSMIQNYCINHHIRPADLRRGLQISSASLYDMFKRPGISTRMLLKVSQVLKHDFFQYYQSELGENIYQKFEQLTSEHQQLQKELENLKIEYEIMKKIFKVS